MKVLLLSHSGGVGGATRSLQAVAKDLTELGASVSVLAPQGSMQDEWRDDGHAVYTWKPPYCPWLLGAVYTSGLVKFRLIMLALLGLLPLKLYRSYKVISERIKLDSPDYIHINSLTLFPLLIILNRLERRSRKKFKVVWHLRELINPRLFSPVRSWIVNGISKKSYKIIAITENEAEAFSAVKPHVIHNTIPVSWRHEALPTRKSNKFKVVMASALSPSKGIKNYFEVARLVKKVHPEAEFDLFTPMAANTFKSVFESCRETKDFMDGELNELDRLDFKGSVSWLLGRKISKEAYMNYSMYIRPDQAGAPWGRDIIEALWMGIPVVATGSYEGFVKPGVNGYLVAVGDVKAMADLICNCIVDKQLRDRLSKGAERTAHELFSAETHRSKLSEVFQPV